MTDEELTYYRQLGAAAVTSELLEQGLKELEGKPLSLAIVFVRACIERGFVRNYDVWRNKAYAQWCTSNVPTLGGAAWKPLILQENVYWAEQGTKDL
jgi:hypothetical protein